VDRLVENSLKDFLKTTGIESTGKETKDFERFCNYFVVSSEFLDNFDVLDVTSGDSNDTALDGIAILVNGSLVDSSEEVICTP
jgi:hypothetical protein